jgi:hypothetical protein
MPAPSNTVLPLIAGTQEVGYQITCSNGTWTYGVDTYAYQWQQSEGTTGVWSSISGAAASVYTILADDVDFKLRCKVTAKNGSGSTEAISLDSELIADDWFIVEDGTGKDDAISFVSIDYARTYHAQRNNTAWGQLGVGVMKAALVKATDYIGQVYRSNWKGSRVNSVQSLDWPRSFVKRDDFDYHGLNGYTQIGGEFYFASNQVPEEVKKACCELALKAASVDLSPDIKRLKTSEKIGLIEVKYNEKTQPYDQYRTVDNLLTPFLKSMPGGVSRVVEI